MQQTDSIDKDYFIHACSVVAESCQNFSSETDPALIKHSAINIKLSLQALSVMTDDLRTEVRPNLLGRINKIIKGTLIDLRSLHEHELNRKIPAIARQLRLLQQILRVAPN